LKNLTFQNKKEIFMSISQASIIGGAALTVYGGYRYFTAQGSEAEINKQKNVAKLCMTAGLAVIAGGIAMNEEVMKFFATTPQVVPQAAPVAEAPKVIEGVFNCSIDTLKGVLQKTGENSATSRVFSALSETQGVTCENFLPWQEAFHRGGTGYIDGIHSDQLSKDVMWGIDQWQRPFIAMKYLCQKVLPEGLSEKIQGATTLFQRYTNAAFLVTGGHFEAKHCMPNLGMVLETSKDKGTLLSTLTKLFNNQTISEKVWGSSASSIALASA